MWKQIKRILLSCDVELVEVFFGLQSVGTSSFSLFFLEESTTLFTDCFLVLSCLSSIPQIIAVYAEKLHARHWTNFSTAGFSFLIAFSLMGQGTDGIAIAGYAFLGMACMFCFWRTDISIRERRDRDD